MAVKYWENLAGWMENTGCCKTLSRVEMQDEFMESTSKHNDSATIQNFTSRQVPSEGHKLKPMRHSFIVPSHRELATWFWRTSWLANGGSL
ncbi:hypothetical protein LOK49_LG07G03002 [Camellia lanceoleosa]|uniref:Uncharacterized protein n=1 Tax=Camellia lanceoleosa TaxID=1840588 RepID=A0ACC0H250_9ERIC|nr:hypothetical protein LOK49_LG07G03002 [Camellia lanceoleosa]